jgi:hypothetical protein
MFTADRCSGWELEELIVRAIRSDNRAQHHAFWREAGHDDQADIRVRINGDLHLVQIKSGVIGGGYLTLSGHRLGRFRGDLQEITEYLNNNNAEIISVPYRKIDDDTGRRHIYRIVYADAEHLTGLWDDDWEQLIGPRGGVTWAQTNQYGVEFSLRPSMSWQIWWKIPENLLEQTADIIIV